jgi:uncharacterized protein involved in response to NO
LPEEWKLRSRGSQFSEPLRAPSRFSEPRRALRHISEGVNAESAVSPVYKDARLAIRPGACQGSSNEVIEVSSDSTIPTDSPAPADTASAGFIPPGVVTESDELKSAPLWRSEPYRIFFPAGVLLAWAGVAHWLLHALGYLEDYRPIFHAMTQIQGFLMCFAVGFLFTMIPRRTGSAPPSAWQIVLCLACAISVSIAAWFGRFGIAQFAWLILAATLVTFAVRRFLDATSKRRPPNSFVWIPLSLFMGVLGSGLTAAFAILGPEYFQLHVIGKGLVLQGMFTGLVLGVGGLAIPLMTRGQAPPDARAGARDGIERAAHLAGALILIASFFVEAGTSSQLGHGMRAIVSLLALALGAQAWRLPTAPGNNRRLIWLSAWMIPLGYTLAALWPTYRIAALHVVFIGGFALLALAVSMQVTLGHGGDQERAQQWPWQVTTMGALMLLAVVLRAAMEFDPTHFFYWMGSAAIAFLCATGAWATLVVPYFTKRPD